MPLEELPDTPNDHYFAEVAVNNVQQFSTGVTDLLGEDSSYFVIGSNSTPRVYLAFVGYPDDLAAFNREADQLEEFWGSAVIRGRLWPSPQKRDELIEHLSEQRPEMTAENTLMGIYVGPYREGHYDNMEIDLAIVETINWIVVIFAAVGTIIFFVVHRSQRAKARTEAA